MTVGLLDRAQEHALRAHRRLLWPLVSPSERSNSAVSWTSDQYVAVAPSGSVYHHGGRRREPGRVLPGGTVRDALDRPRLPRSRNLPGRRRSAAEAGRRQVRRCGRTVGARNFRERSLLPNTAPLSKDTKGRPLEAWPFGRYVVAPGTVWVASSYHPRSFDSRYFGPISTAAIRHRLKPFLTL